MLPAFRDVRLIPIDAASSGGDGSFDLEWRRHIDEHLPIYLATGRRQGSCRYCANLDTWERAAFRREGSDWLRQYSHLCTLPAPGPGPGRGGGTRRGH